MVPSRNTVPTAIKIIGPEKERRWRGGGTWTGLTISHLSWRNLSWSDLDIAGYGARCSGSERHRWRRRWRLALQQLGYSDGKKQHGPRTVPARTIDVLKKRKKSHGH